MWGFHLFLAITGTAKPILAIHDTTASPSIINASCYNLSNLGTSTENISIMLFFLIWFTNWLFVRIIQSFGNCFGDLSCNLLLLLFLCGFSFLHFQLKPSLDCPFFIY
jgi:hypothetical protein